MQALTTALDVLPGSTPSQVPILSTLPLDSFGLCFVAPSLLQLFFSWPLHSRVERIDLLEKPVIPIFESLEELNSV